MRPIDSLLSTAIFHRHLATQIGMFKHTFVSIECLQMLRFYIVYSFTDINKNCRCGFSQKYSRFNVKCVNIIPKRPKFDPYELFTVVAIFLATLYI